MTGDIQAIARALGGEVSGGQILAPGPGHNPRDRSLSIKLTPNTNDGFLVKSFSGDDWKLCRDHVRQRLGLPEFAPASGSRSIRIFQGPFPEAGTDVPSVSEYETPVPPQSHPTLGRWSAWWTYRDAAGRLLGYACRFDRPSGKQILPLTLQESGTGLVWQWKAFGTPRPLYGLDRLAARPESSVLVVEGEKAADAAQAIFADLVAVTSPGGAEAAGKADWFPLMGRTVTIWPDADAPGLKYANVVTGLLQKSGVRIIRLVNTEGLPDGWDLADTVPDGPDIRQRLDQAANLLAIANLISARDLEHKDFPPLQWVVPDYLPEGLTLLAGRPKIGKSWLTLDLCIAVARGGYSLSGLTPCHEGDVLYCALEDNERRIQRRMRKVMPSGWPHRLKFLMDLPRLEDGGLDVLERWCEAVESPRLIAIDTLAKIRKSKTANETDYQADYRAMDGLAKLAARFGMAIVVVHHVRKAESVSDPFDAISGTTGLTGSVDAAIVLNRCNMGVTLYARGRDIEELEKAVEFRTTDCRWHVLGNSADVHKSDERRTILETLKQADTELSPADIARETGTKSANVRFLLKEMLAAGDIQKSGYGKYKVKQNATY